MECSSPVCFIPPQVVPSFFRRTFQVFFIPCRVCLSSGFCVPFDSCHHLFTWGLSSQFKRESPSFFSTHLCHFHCCRVVISLRRHVASFSLLFVVVLPCCRREIAPFFLSPRRRSAVLPTSSSFCFIAASPDLSSDSLLLISLLFLSVPFFWPRDVHLPIIRPTSS